MNLVMTGFKEIDWMNMNQVLLTNKDTISNHLVDSFERAKENIRQQTNCDTINQSNVQEVQDCIKQKITNTDFYNEMKTAADNLKDQINDLKQDANVSPERKARANDMADRIAEIESQPLTNSSISPQTCIVLLVTIVTNFIM